MKKSLLLLALTAAVSGSAFAQSSNVSLYGTVDMGVTAERGNGVSETKLTSGAASMSRIGFKGSEDLGNGVKAFFQLEGGFDAGTGENGSSLFGRQSFIGLSSAELGTVSVGRQFNFGYETLRDIADPFAAGTAARANNLTVDAFTFGGTSNLVKYVSPSISGLTFGASFAKADDVAGEPRTVAFNGTYVAGPMTAAVTHTTMTLVGEKLKSTLVAGSYDFKIAKAHAAFGMNKIDGLVDTRDYILGASYPVMAGTKLMASYVRTDDRMGGNFDADQFGIGLTHSLSKRTDVYAAYARISDDNGAGYTVGNNSDIGVGNKGLNIGLRHSF